MIHERKSSNMEKHINLMTKSNTSINFPSVHLSIPHVYQCELCLLDAVYITAGLWCIRLRYFLFHPITGFAGTITFRASNCYDNDVGAGEAVSDGSYYQSKDYETSDCKYAGILMEFKNGPVKLNWISWDEPAGMEGGVFTVTGATDTGALYRLGSRVKSGTKVKNQWYYGAYGGIWGRSEKFRFIQVDADREATSNCPRGRNGGYVMAIENLKFSVTA